MKNSRAEIEKVPGCLFPCPVADVGPPLAKRGGCLYHASSEGCGKIRTWFLELPDVSRPSGVLIVAPILAAGMLG